MVVAGYITPLSLVMPHHDHTVLSGQEVAVRLPRVPVFIELGRGVEEVVNLNPINTRRNALRKLEGGPGGTPDMEGLSRNKARAQGDRDKERRGPGERWE